MLPTIWFFIWGLLWAIYFATDGYDLGLGSLHPFIARSDRERRAVLDAVAPFWDANQVWLVSAGGMTFAVFPIVYATLFSTLYGGMMLLLFGLIFRSVAIELRNKTDNAAWRTFWDGALAVGSFVPTILLGLVFANLFRGLPIDAEHNLKGGLLSVFNPYGLLGAVLFFLLFGLHGLLWLGYKTQGDLYSRSVTWAKIFWMALVVVLVIFLIASAPATNLYANYLRYPVLLIFPALIVISLLLIRVFLARNGAGKALLACGVMIFLITMGAFAGLYPNIIFSTLGAAHSLTVHNASSSALTLKVMLVVVILFVPVVLAYQIWANYIFRGKVAEGEGYEVSD